MEQFIGKEYSLVSSDNFEEYLKFMEIGYFSRKTALAVTPVSKLVLNDDGSYTFTMSTTFKSTKITFKLGEEFVEERADGVKVNSIIVVDGNKLVQTQTEENGRKTVHVREFSPEMLIVTTTAEGWDGKCVRTYKLVK